MPLKTFSGLFLLVAGSFLIGCGPGFHSGYDDPYDGWRDSSIDNDFHHRHYSSPYPPSYSRYHAFPSRLDRENYERRLRRLRREERELRNEKAEIERKRRELLAERRRAREREQHEETARQRNEFRQRDDRRGDKKDTWRERRRQDRDS